MAKRKHECTPEEWERQKAMSRERNRRYLAKNDPHVKARRAIASKAYLYRLASDAAYTDKADDRRRKAVERSKQWQAANPEKAKEHAKAARQNSPEKQAEKTMRRNAAKILATPAWANHGAIVRHYANARYLSSVTGHLHHVDHIIPLRSKTVCGLHVENNLRVVPHFINTRKGNRLEGV